ncbi:hypothetical protein H0Z11_17225 [Pantoea agglomerans]|uniref:hypothetical protein n=1 Tax=Enterobacter agglomerans TaxID=549 RepID=UPI001AA01CA4|nr:hypothetical protein [Pantoea agglomerans]QTC49954.1 hypothetical protein H0Z11_17225 [Pantoea agglomerans]
MLFATLKKTAIKLSLLLLVATSCASMAGCTVNFATAVNKALTFRDYQTYRTNIKYWTFVDGKRDRQSTYTMQVQDKNEYVFYIMDYGSYKYLGSVTVKTFDEDIKPYREFLKWATQPADEREQTAKALADSEIFRKRDFSLYTEKDTQEPLLIITRNPAFYVPTGVYAMNKQEVARLILQSYEIKSRYEKGIKNPTDYDTAFKL